MKNAAQVIETEMETPMNTDLAEAPTQQLPMIQQDQPMGVSPLVAMLANGQLNPEHIEKAMELQEKHDAYQAKKAFSVAMARFRSLAPVLRKDANVNYTTQKGTTNYDHTSLGYAMSEVNPLLGQCELNLSWHPRQDDGLVYVKTRLTHTLGHSESVELFAAPDNSGNKNAIQAVKSTITYLERTGAFSLLGLASGDDDDGRGASTSAPLPAPLTAKSMSTIIDLLERADELSEGFSKRWKDAQADKYGSTDTPLGLAIPESHAQPAIDSLTNRIKEKETAQ